ncbi:MAG TPA: efflux RND transporter periplasmic adaptor subunit, partial [Plasticicumulans sp.]|nr:efflux RND transporter periplasmic adaptor subunit [Plasticicumulans sp.]
ADVREAPVLPIDAVPAGAAQASLWRVREGRLESVTVETGLRDAEAGYVEIRSGLDVGDRILLRPARTLQAGTPVEILPVLR